MHLQKQLVKIENSVRKFMKQLKDVKPTPTCESRPLCCVGHYNNIPDTVAHQCSVALRRHENVSLLQRSNG